MNTKPFGPGLIAFLLLVLVLAAASGAGAEISDVYTSRLKGVLLLLGFCVVFSGINFVASNRDQPFGTLAGRYLVLWVLVNFLFALMLIVLLFNNSLSEMNKDTFLACFIAAVSPELLTNFKFRIGKSDESFIDLSVYKTRALDAITRQLQAAGVRRQKQELLALNHYFKHRLAACREKLVIFLAQADLAPTERESVAALVEAIRQERDLGTGIFELLQDRKELVAKLCAYFREEIVLFERSPEGRLMYGLQPELTIEEASCLVSSGITGPGPFLRRALLPFSRARLARTGLPIERVRELSYTTRSCISKRWTAKLQWLAVLLLCFSLAAVLFRQQVSKEVPVAQNVAVVSTGTISDRQAAEILKQFQ